MRIVCKFGGSSLAGVERVRACAAILSRLARSGVQLAAVLSAQGDTTDTLLRTAERYTPHPAPRELDMLLSTGEQQSVALMAMALSDMGIPAVSLTGWQAGMGTDAAFGRARLRTLSPARVERELGEGKLVLIAGFQGVSPQGDITTLGRGGSDTTAVAAAAALGAEECRIYTDVEGVYTADPRAVEGARLLPEIDAGEMHILAAMGAKVLHERSAALAERMGVPVTVLSSFSDAPGTRIVPLPLGAEEHRLTAAAEKAGLVSLVGKNLHLCPELGPEARSALEAAGIGVRSYLQTPGRLTVQVTPEQGRDALRCLHRTFLE